MTVFPRQRHCTLGLGTSAAYPPADITVERTGELVNYYLSVFLGAVDAGHAEQETP
jgi:hypothetical protein